MSMPSGCALLTADCCQTFLSVANDFNMPCDKRRNGQLNDLERICFLVDIFACSEI